MNQLDTRRHNGKVFGAVLIGLGILLLVGQLFSFEFLHWSFGQLPWPTFVIVPGVVLVALGVVMGRSGLAVTIIGTLASTTGLILAFQDYTGAFQTWAYAWALVVPTSIGLSMMLHGRITYQGELARRGLKLFVIGLVMFGIGFAFFEFTINLSGFGNGTLVRLVGPVLLIGLGVYSLLRRNGRIGNDDLKIKNSSS
jgi:hypothetical protein